MSMNRTSLAATSHNVISSRYRPDIDGLRAIAILAVIVNHFSNGQILPSGYLGVDIFFVVSGFVITSSLENDSNTIFSRFIVRFFSRRVKRLLPALFLFVCLTSFLVVFFCNQPQVILRTGALSLVGLSNFYILKQSTDYFSQSIDYNVFAHTWSLGVEEQFYALFPLLIWFTGFSRSRPRSRFYLLCACTTLFTLSLSLYIHLSIFNPSAAYFLMPARLWELTFGCIIYLIRDICKGLVALARFFPIAALICSVLSMTLFPDSQSLVATVIIVTCTGVILVFSQESKALYFLLSYNKLVFLGKISYSLYLWHWGFLSLVMWTIGLSIQTLPFLIALTGLFSIASYAYIETPIRLSGDCQVSKLLLKGCNSKGLASFLAASLASYILLLMCGSRLYLGKSSRNSVNVDGAQDWSEHIPSTNIRCNIEAKDFESFCVIPPKRKAGKKVFIIGDSHAGHLIPLLGLLKRDRGVGLIISTAGIFPHVFEKRIPGTSLDQSSTANVRKREVFNSQMTTLSRGDTLILASRWNHYLFESLNDAEYNGVRRIFYNAQKQMIQPVVARELFFNQLGEISKFARARGINVLLFGVMPSFTSSGSPLPYWVCERQWFRPVIPKSCYYNESKELIVKRSSLITSRLRQIADTNPNAHLFEPFELLCPDKLFCRNYYGSVRLFRDDDHLTSEGSRFIYPYFLRFVDARKIF